MSVQTQEARIILAIEAIRTTKKMSVRCVVKTYDVPKSFFYYRMKGHIAKCESRYSRYNLTSVEKETIVRYILDLNTRRFPPRIKGVEDIANLLLITYIAKHVDKNWTYRFIQHRPKFKIRFSRTYDFQRALYENSDLTKKWFILMKNIYMKYGSIYNNYISIDNSYYKTCFVKIVKVFISNAWYR